MNKGLKTGVFLLLAVLFFHILPAARVSAAEYELKVGKRLDISQEGAVYRSSDKSVAYVSRDGYVTAKKEGTASVSVIKDDIKVVYRLVVKKSGKKPALKVAADEIRIVTADLVFQGVDEETGGYTYIAKIKLKNTSDRAVASVYMTAVAGEADCRFLVKGMEGNEVKTLTKTLTLDHEEEELSIGSLRVRTGGMHHTCNYMTGKTSYEYAAADTTAPVITGFVGKDSYNDGIPYQTVYRDNADSFDYFKYVRAVDDRDTKVKLQVDTDEVDFSKKGIYTITYTAVDSAGNKAKKKAKIAVRVNDSYDDLADSVLDSIIRPGWSDKQKVTAVYNYAHGHINYTGTSNKDSWEKAAKSGILTGRGDCFTYYAVVRLLLTRAGIPNLEVTRVQGYGHHWWNMAYVQGGFYHVDACPRRRGGKLCLLTDAQLKQYSKNVGNGSHIWDYDGKPESATKKLADY